MSESALEKARRELLQLTDYGTPAQILTVREAIIRLEAAAREEEAAWWRTAVEKWADVNLRVTPAESVGVYSGRYGGTPSMMLQAIVAAARLAGRIAGLEWVTENLANNHDGWWRAVGPICEAVEEEIDRLRHEAEAAGEEGK